MPLVWGYKNVHHSCINSIMIDKENRYLFSISNDQSLKVFYIKDPENWSNDHIYEYTSNNMGI